MRLPKLFSWRLRRRPTGRGPNDTNTLDGSPSIERLSVLIQSLKLLEKVADAANIPYLKGAIGTALVIAECARGYKSTNESLNALAVRCGDLMVNIANHIQSGSDLSEGMYTLVSDLYQTLERCQDVTNHMTTRERYWKIVAYDDNQKKIDGLHIDITNALLRFQTLSTIVNHRPSCNEDKVFTHAAIELEELYCTGDDWIAFRATVTADQQQILVKKYTSNDIVKRKRMHAYDIEAFKKNWKAHLIEYMGTSRAREEYPYIVLRGFTSDHVNIYLAGKFRENNERGSAEGLKFLVQLTNAMSFMVGTTDSSSLDITKVHLNNSGNIVIVDLQPTLDEITQAKNDMPYWRNWQMVCLELLSGNVDYEPNPNIECRTNPDQDAILTYLRPILGHIHCGGLRFKDNIHDAFKRQALMLNQIQRHLQEMQSQPRLGTSSEANRLLRALWRRHSRELHYVAHYREPLLIDVGDIGYVIGNPPKFICLDSVSDEILDDLKIQQSAVKRSRFIPKGRWTTKEINGVIRHQYRFYDSDAKDLSEWRNGRPRLDKDFKLRRINIPKDHGLVVDCSRAWEYLSQRASDLALCHTDNDIRASDLILVVYFKQQSGYATFRLNNQLDNREWSAVWAEEGLDAVPEAVYFYESPPGGSDGVWGYFSFSPTPGNPHINWTPKSDDEGESWGWTLVSKNWTVEISKPSIKQYIRYVQL